MNSDPPSPIRYLQSVILIWDISSQKVISVLKYMSNETTAIALSNSGKIAFGSYEDQSLHLFHSNTHQIVRLLGLRGITASMLVFSPDDVLLAANCGDAIVLWDIADAYPIVRLRVNSGPFTSLSFTTSPGIVCGNSEILHRWVRCSGRENEPPLIQTIHGSPTRSITNGGTVIGSGRAMNCFPSNLIRRRET